MRLTATMETSYQYHFTDENETQGRKVTDLRVDGLPKAQSGLSWALTSKSVPRGTLSSLSLWVPHYWSWGQHLLRLHTCQSEERAREWWVLCWAWEPKSKPQRTRSILSMDGLKGTSEVLTLQRLCEHLRNNFGFFFKTAYRLSITHRKCLELACLDFEFGGVWNICMCMRYFRDETQV